MVKYTSSKPTNQKRKLFQFMESKKTSGTVSGKAVGKYITNHGYKIKPNAKNGFAVFNKTGTLLMTAGIHKRKPRINMWHVR